MKGQITVVIPSIRHDFPVLSHWTHMNCGGMAPLSHAVGAELIRVPQAVLQEGPLRLMHHDEDFLGHEAARQAIANFIGADADEISFTTQFSTGVNIVVEGLPWQEGDEFIVTDEEHPALLIPLMNMAKRRGLVPKRVAVSHDPEKMLADFRKVLSDRTRLVAMSHVTTDSSTRIPAAEITQLAHEQGSLVLFDGAHSVGQFPVDMRALDCDFYAMVGYKWLLGPYPSGALYIRASLLDQLAVTWCGSRSTRGGGVTMGIDDVEWIDGARRFEYGGRTFPYDTAMAVGLNYVNRLGVDAVREHSQTLSCYFHEGLREIKGAEIHSPRRRADMTGINTVSLANMDGVALSAALRERFKIITRPALRGTTVRISLAAFIEQSDVDYLLASLTKLAAE